MADRGDSGDIGAAYSSNTVVVAITAVSGLVAAVNAFVGLWGAPAFWSDCASAALMGCLSSIWLKRIISKAHSNRVLRGSAATIQDRLRGLDFPISVFVILVGLFAWSAWLPLAHAFRPKWFLCGTFVSKCQKKPASWPTMNEAA